MIKHISSQNYKASVGNKKNILLFIEGSEELCPECPLALKVLKQSIKRIKKQHPIFKHLKVLRLNIQLNEVRELKVREVPQLIMWDHEHNTYVLEKPL